MIKSHKRKENMKLTQFEKQLIIEALEAQILIWKNKQKLMLEIGAEDIGPMMISKYESIIEKIKK